MERGMREDPGFRSASSGLHGRGPRMSRRSATLVGFTAVLMAGRGGLVLAQDHAPGLAAAFVAAFVWATYSVLSRRFAAVPTDAVAGFCLATATLAAVCHLAFETTVWPGTAGQWIAVIALGLAP